MFLRIWRLLTLILVALFMGLEFAHTLELPDKMQYEGALYVTVQNSLYRYFGAPGLGAFVTVGAVLCAIASVLGLLLFVIGWWIISLSFKANTFAATAVKHQTERQQTVIDPEVYSIVRHPMYAGTVLVMVGISLWLESYAAALLEIVPMTILVIRIHFEEQFLRQELEGYDNYTQKVRYKLLPYLW
ncbi:methyltransferase family protein [Scytonema sp. NUACC26]|uniref:methyltransferase family protein n=1 Tax=Scytonema sp. NUACC26 TaxID=3140176 RepID=UPI0034DBEE26